jgi:hypothetical protein
MPLFKDAEPLLRRKQEALDIQDRVGLWKLDWQIGSITLISATYTRVDQAFLLWGSIAILIFTIAQFFPVSWNLQALIWSSLTLLGSVGTIVLTYFWAEVEQLCWIVYAWVGLMLTGMILTDLSIWGGWGTVLLQLCPLWLGICAAGYLITAWGLRSRALLLTGIAHLLGIALLPYVGGWQFLATAAIIGGSLLLLAESQWDMRPPIASPKLTEAQREFNRRQHQLRQSRTI